MTLEQSYTITKIMQDHKVTLIEEPANAYVPYTYDDLMGLSADDVIAVLEHSKKYVVITDDGGMIWWENDELHRDGGPAIECVDGTCEFWIRGERTEK